MIQKISTEELNSSLDYFLDVDVSKHNEDLLHTLLTCAKQDCDVEKLKRLFLKLNYSEEEIKKYNLKDSLRKFKTVEEMSNIEDESVKRVKLSKFKKSSTFEFDFEKICENYNQIKSLLPDLLEDKDLISILNESSPGA